MNPPLPFDVDVQTVKQQLDRGAILLLDCREAGEVAVARIEGSLWIPMREIPARLSELGPDLSRRIVVYCHHGGRSRQVTQFLRRQGFENTQNMAGGIDAWSQLVDPTIPRYD
jgi:rhodanese-related sulfurtransferase